MVGVRGEDEAKNQYIQIISMVGGEDESSYARNSSFQRMILWKVQPILEKSIEELLGEMEEDDLKASCIKVADLGCSSGPNAFLTMEHIIESVDKAAAGRIRNDQEPPAIQIFLNDLVSNDFNLVFKWLPQFYEKLEQEHGRRFGSCLVAAMPGSFHRKLFPDRSMHFIHSSYGLHWLSQAPKGLVTESGIPMNKGSIHCGKKSPSIVQKLYLDQFRQDFSMFLRMRSQEMVHHGHLLLTLLCENEDYPQPLDLMEMALSDLVNEGCIKEEKMDYFNVPFYDASVDEIKQVIENEGSFKIQELHILKINCGDEMMNDVVMAGDRNDLRRCYDDPCSLDTARRVTSRIRAVYEPILTAHFGEAIMDNLFRRYADKLIINFFKMAQCSSNTLVISLRKD